MKNIVKAFEVVDHIDWNFVFRTFVNDHIKLVEMFVFYTNATVRYKSTPQSIAVDLIVKTNLTIPLVSIINSYNGRPL